MSQSPMINLYALLNIGPYVDSASVSAAIHTSRKTGDINAAILDKAEQWLLNPAIRQRYDAQLRQQQPEFFLASPTTDSWQLDAGQDEVRLGVLEKKNPDGVSMEPVSHLDQVVYIHEQNRYNALTKTIIYGGIALVIIAIVLAIAWPMLKKPCLPPVTGTNTNICNNLCNKAGKKTPKWARCIWNLPNTPRAWPSNSKTMMPWRC